MTKILIIEDSEGLAVMWKRYLETAGLPVVCALTWRDALFEMVKIPPPDLVFLDLHLPDSRTAEETLSKIETIRKYNPSAVIIAVTGMVTGDKIVQMASEAGADAFRFKDTIGTQQTFLSAVKTILGAKKASPRALTEQGLSILEKLSAYLPS